MDTCESRGALCVPPAYLATDPGPEPPRTIITTFPAADAARTADNELGWQPSKQSAADVATSKATHAAGERCADGGGKLKRVFMVVEMTPCQVKKEMGSEVWNCYLKAQVECEKHAENPEHPRWEAAKRAAAIDRSRGAQLDAAHEQCLGGRQRAIDACAADCRRQNLCAGAGASGDPRTSPTRGNDGGTTDRGGRTGPPTQPYNPNAAAEGIAAANAQSAAIDASFDKAMGMFADAKRREGTLTGPAAGIAVAGVFAPAFGVIINDVGFDSFVLNVALPVLVGGLFVNGTILGPWAYNKSYWWKFHVANVPYYQGQVEGVCRERGAEQCAEARGELLRYLSSVDPSGSRSFLRFLLGPAEIVAPAFATHASIGIARGSLDSEGMSVDHTGYFFQASARRGLSRVSFEIRNTWGDLTGDGELEGIQAYGVGMGLQLGAGFLSPYAELRAHALGSTNRDAFDGYYDADFSLRLGNTFNFHGLGAKAGDFTGGMAIDAGLMLPVGARTESGFYVGLGFGWNKAMAHDGFNLAEQLAPRDPRRVELMAARILVSTGGLGAGVDVAHFRFRHPYVKTLTVGDVRLLTRGGVGFSAVMPGHEWWRGPWRAFAAATPLALTSGEEFRGIGNIRLGGGVDTEHARLDAGLELPLYWSNDEGAYSSADPVSFFVRMAY